MDRLQRRLLGTALVIAGAYLAVAAVLDVDLLMTSPSAPFYGTYLMIGAVGALGIILVILGVTFWRRPRAEPVPYHVDQTDT